MSVIALIDYGAGNLRSVHNALVAAGAQDVAVTADPDVVAKADRIVLPGVGAFAACMNGLSAIDGLVDAMERRVRGEGAPFLGICVGMQLLADAGEEHGTHQGLGWIGGTVRAFDPAPGLRIPHMGWNDVTPTGDHAVIASGEAYFLHGYHFAETADVAATSDHGGPFVAAVARDNIVGVQYHPEKSQAYGLATLERFLNWRP
ncbi:MULTISPECIES: imidazole glycerol phosphate synthase subunit HisH [unclassified Sphingopyxis]|uniref:imidazole glycerol phosphate synthase subunit HisH n=1 Tax=unclassified Sphingopyxis TaxID=2614943 RepID=UPI000736403A|nr:MULTISPECIES: imidazole glycerol phosphate synthase subunit HisH [unclassified Sphingopyxis]KTE37307.1 imidazole glycerol phosphate synthase subunit HisH [Sphingopyxis sp. HIX]KTE84307.1 imidazole glycerol phosphate synthase subunit HisH [Sphingopyxis sp. HXXIV]